MMKSDDKLDYIVHQQQVITYDDKIQVTIHKMIIFKQDFRMVTPMVSSIKVGLM
jgi:hypothetical protein